MKGIFKYINFILKVLLLNLIYLLCYTTNEFVYEKEDHQQIILTNNFLEIKELKRLLQIDKGFYIDSLKKTLDYVDTLEKQLKAMDYTRFKLWLETEVMIPYRFPDKYLQLIIDRSKERNIPIKILVRLINRESQFKKNARSYKGASGYMQIMPATYNEHLSFSLRGINSSEQNLEVGINYLCFLYDFWKYRKPKFTEKQIWKFVLASYNAGPNKVVKYNGIPPYTETINYVKYIMNE
jgi:soluble lytic murein transglycosylase-like protein